MMYLGIFVFVVLTASGLELNDKERGDGPFSCPSCQGNSLKACDDNIENEECKDLDEPVCVLGRITGGKTQTYGRYCYSREDYNDLKDYCDSYPADCTAAMCDQSGCKAELANSDEGFKCPFCTARGDNAKADCDANIILEDCNRQNPICEITKYSFGRTVRQCSDMDAYQTSLSNCEKYKNCEKAMCEESECIAEFTADKPMECPYCTGQGENALEECDKNITYKACKEPNMVCGVARVKSKVARGCTTGDRVDRFIKTCRKSRAPKPCNLGICEESRCKAKLRVTECPYCESYTTLEDCDRNIETEKCTQPDARCFVRKQVYGSSPFFMRGCMDEETSKRTTYDCTQGVFKDVCQFGICQKNGCRASFEN